MAWILHKGRHINNIYNYKYHQRDTKDTFKIIKFYLRNKSSREILQKRFRMNNRFCQLKDFNERVSRHQYPTR